MGGIFVVGSVVDDKYRITEELGEGAMGFVYGGEHLVLGRPVAVKTMQKEFLRNQEAVARFHQEARAASAIGSRHIVEVFDLGETPDGSLYMVMEKLQGIPLDRYISRHAPMRIRSAVQILGQTLSGLGAAHRKGIIHRDLKPENVFICTSDDDVPYVKILDFGVAKVLQPHTITSPSNKTEVSKTQAGMVMGTALYMSPEQAKGDLKLDHRTDIWAAGVVLYEMLTGRTPFDGDNYNQVLFAITEGQFPPPSTVRPELRGPLESILLKALATDPDQRYRSAKEMRAALNSFLKAPAQVTPTALPTAPHMPSLVGDTSVDAPDSQSLSDFSALSGANLVSLDGASDPPEPSSPKPVEKKSQPAAVVDDAAFAPPAEEDFEELVPTLDTNHLAAKAPPPQIQSSPNSQSRRPQAKKLELAVQVRREQNMPAHEYRRAAAGSPKSWIIFTSIVAGGALLIVLQQLLS